MKKDVLTYFAGKLAPAFVNLAIIIFAVRILGSKEYGIYSLVFYAAMLIGTLSFGWIQQGILRFLSAYPGEQEVVTGRFLFLTLVSSLAGVLAGVLVSVLYFGLNPVQTLIVASYILLYNLFQFRLVLNQAMRRPTRYAVLESLYNLSFISLFLILTLWLMYREFTVLFIAMILGLLATELFRAVIARHSGEDPGQKNIHFDRGFAGKIFGFGFPMTLWLFISYLVNISDRFIIREFTGYEDVGTYSAIKDFIIKAATFSTIPILLSYHPTIVEKWNRGKQKEAMGLIREGILYCVAVAIAVFIIVFFGHNFFYSGILHLDVNNRIIVTVTLTIASFLWQMAMLIHKPLELLLKPGLMIMAILSAWLVNTGFNLLFVPVYGYAAAAVSTLISVATYILITLAYIRHFQNKGML